MKTSETRIRSLLGLGAVGAAVAMAVNALIYGLGRAADVDYVITRSSDGVERVALADIISLSLMSFAVGLVAVAVTVRWRHRGLRAFQVLGAVLAVVSTWGDFFIDGTAAAKATLALMHLVVGAAYVTSLQAARAASATTVRSVPLGATRFDPIAA